MATITVTANDNIKNVAYSTGDTIALSNSANPFVRLTIDAQDAGDVAKVAGAFPALFSASVSGELYVVNTSTTTPLVITMSGGAMTTRTEGAG